MPNERKRAKNKTPKQLAHVKRQKLPRLAKMLLPACYAAVMVDGSELPDEKQKMIAAKMAATAAAVLLDELDLGESHE